MFVTLLFLLYITLLWKENLSFHRNCKQIIHQSLSIQSISCPSLTHSRLGSLSPIRNLFYLKWSVSLSVNSRHRNQLNMKRNMFENQNPQIPIPKEFRSDQPSHFYSQRTYDDMKLSKYITMVVNYLQLDRPSKIQAMSFAYIVNGTSCILADQTGSGKTLGYLLPIIQRLYSNTPMLSTSTTSCSDTTSLSNRNNRKNVEERKVLYPKVLIMAPTAELASQVSKVVRSISSVLRFRSICLTSGSHSLQDEISNLPNTATTLDDNGNPSITNVEFLIATPGRLFSSLKNGDISLAKTSAIVLDEADVLFLDESFPLQGIGRYLPESLSTDEGSVSKTQFVFVTATLPDVIAKQISREFPEAITLKGPGLHRIPPTVEEILVDCSLPPPRTSPLGGRLTARTSQRQYNEAVAEKKRVELIHALTSNSEVDRTLIFCNTIETCRFVENALIRIDRNEQIRKILGYHGAIDPRKRVDNLNEFTRRLLPLPVVLVCTDRASRGIDFNNFNVDHVILFDFPQEPSEYVRRVGRTGRAGRFGKVTILVHGRQVPIVKSLLSASKLGKRIDPIPSLNTLSSYSKQDNLQDDDES